jgi:hypothetical protein
VIYGHRVHREDGWRRVIASHVLRATLLLSARVNCVDANVPYRLIRTTGLEAILRQIPEDFFLANVALSVLLRRISSYRHGLIPIKFRERYGGEPSVRLGRFGAKARELLTHLQRLPTNDRK